MSSIVKRVIHRQLLSRQRIIQALSVTDTTQKHRSNHYGRNDRIKLSAAGLVGSAVIYFSLKQHAKAEPNVENAKIFSLEEVSKHKTMETGVWVTYNGCVYDISKFVDQHPGGKKILMAAGGSLEPFWAIYGMHNSAAVKELLEEYRIGELSEKESSEATAKAAIDDPFLKDPRRHPALIPASIKPYNAEPPPALLVDSYTTPNDLFYVRNHMPVPEVDVEKFRLNLIDMNGSKVSLTLDDIKKKFPKVTITAAVQCAGNRRGEMSQVKPVKGLSWGHAAIGNATWSGARLTDVLKYYGLQDKHAQHVHFRGLDAGLDGVTYAASVPADTVLDPHRDVLLAYEMNGAPLPRDHGGPLRVIVPGIVGARNVKWVGSVVLSDKESDSHWQQNDYKGLPPGADWDTADFSKAPAIQELPIQSAICVPENGETVQLEDGAIKVKGYAWSGGGRKVVRVDVSADEGKTWHEAQLDPDHKQQQGDRQWAWSLWKIDLPVPSGGEKVEVWVKAVDSSYNTQPESFAHIWNFRGVLGNAYHKITVNVQ